MSARVLEIVSLFLKKAMEKGWDSGEKEDLIETLMEQGNHPKDINAALSIVEKIQQKMEFPLLKRPQSLSEKYFMSLEELHLPPEVRGYLSYMVSMGVISPIEREDIVERTLLMDPEEITIDEMEMILEEFLIQHHKSSRDFDETISEYYH